MSYFPAFNELPNSKFYVPQQYPFYAYFAEGKKLKMENSDETLWHKLTSPTRTW